eukprot:1157418-Pelagomonas_calceolata.AAC.12
MALLDMNLTSANPRYGWWDILELLLPASQGNNSVSYAGGKCQGMMIGALLFIVGQSKRKHGCVGHAFTANELPKSLLYWTLKALHCCERVAPTPVPFPNSAILGCAWNGLKYKLASLSRSAKGISAQTLNVRNKAGETVLGWILKFCASGDDAPAVTTKGIQCGKSKCIQCANNSGRLRHSFTVHCLCQAGTPAFKESIPPICLAAAIGDLVLLDVISKAAGPDAFAAKDALKRTVLHYCAAKDMPKKSGLPIQKFKGHLEVVRLALETKLVFPSQQDSNKDTALSLAAMAGRDDVEKIRGGGYEELSDALFLAGCNLPFAQQLGDPYLARGYMFVLAPFAEARSFNQLHVDLLLPLAIETTQENPKIDKTAAEIVLLQTNKEGTSILAQALRSGPLPKAQMPCCQPGG